MGTKDLRAWIEKLEAEGELKRIKAEVDWNLELAAIARTTWAQEEGASSLLFENIKDYKKGRCTKLFTGGLELSSLGSRRRMTLMLGVPKDTPRQELVQVLRKRFKEPIKPVRVKTGPVKENILKGKDVDLFSLPVPKYNALDGGRYINTFCGVVTRDPDSGELNVGLYRGMVHTKNEIGVYIVPSKHWGLHYSKYQAMGKPMPVAIVYGWDPSLFLLAGTALPTCEYDVSGAIRQEPVELVKCETSDLEVPASAEIVVEGFISPDPATYRMEGPFGEWTGYYGWARKRPVLEVSCMTHRTDPIYVGRPTGSLVRRPREEKEGAVLMDIGSSALYWNILESQGVPGVLDVIRGRMTMAVKIHKTYQGQARQVAAALWGSKGVDELPRVIFVTEEDVDIHQPQALLDAMGSHVRFPEDLVVFPIQVGAALNPVQSVDENDELKWGTGLSTVVLIDATVDWISHPVRPEWGNKRYPPTCADISPEIAALVQRRWKEYGF